MGATASTSPPNKEDIEELDSEQLSDYVLQVGLSQISDILRENATTGFELIEVADALIRNIEAQNRMGKRKETPGQELQHGKMRLRVQLRKFFPPSTSCGMLPEDVERTVWSLSDLLYQAGLQNQIELFKKLGVKGPILGFLAEMLLSSDNLNTRSQTRTPQKKQSAFSGIAEEQKLAFALWMRFILGGTDNLKVVSKYLNSPTWESGHGLHLHFSIEMHGEESKTFDDPDMWRQMRNILMNAGGIDESYCKLYLEFCSGPNLDTDITIVKGHVLGLRLWTEVASTRESLELSVNHGYLQKECLSQGIVISELNISFPDVDGTEALDISGVTGYVPRDPDADEAPQALAMVEIYTGLVGGRTSQKWRQLSHRWAPHVPFEDWPGLVLPNDQQEIREIRLPWNSLAGFVCADIAELSQLTYLDLAGNSLQGEIPDVLASCTLKEIHLQCNKFSGKIPDTLGQCTLLEVLDLSVNSLEGFIPASLGKCAYLNCFKAQRNELYGSIPVSLALCKNLVILDLSDNLLTGRVPECFGKLCLHRLNLRHNKLAGRLPSGLSRVPELYLEGNSTAILGCTKMLRDERRALEQLFSACNGPRWSQKAEWGNHQVKLSQWWGVWSISSRVLSLNLSGNGLSGPIPECLGVLEKLCHLNLSKNRGLTGSIPVDIACLANLVSLDLTGNVNISGQVPETLARRPGFTLLIQSTGLYYPEASLEVALYPLYMIQTDTLLRLERFVPHETALEKGLVVQMAPRSEDPMNAWHYRHGGQTVFVDAMRAQMAFVSHRWLSSRSLQPHPDCKNNTKLRHLQQLAQSYPGIRYWWFDYMCAPQQPAITAHSPTLAQHHVPNAFNSLPHYIKSCETVFLLQKGEDGAKAFKKAGWCRLEVLLAFLSTKVVHQAGHLKRSTTLSQQDFVQISHLPLTNKVIVAGDHYAEKSLARVEDFVVHASELDPLKGTFTNLADKSKLLPCLNFVSSYILKNTSKRHLLCKIAKEIRQSVGLMFDAELNHS